MNPGHETVNSVSLATTAAVNNIGMNVRQPAGAPQPSANTNRTPNNRIPVPIRTSPAAGCVPAAVSRSVAPTGPNRTPGPAQPTARSFPRPHAIGYKIRRISTLRRYCVPITTALLVLASIVVIAILIKVVLDNYYFFCIKSFKFIPLDKWCDGQTDCSGNEDELRCVQKIDLANISTVRFTESGSILQLLSSQGRWTYICYDGFDAAKAKAVCGQIGFSSDPSFYSVSAAGLNGLFSTIVVTSAGIQTIPISGTACPSGSVVSLRCLACGVSNKKDRIVGGQDTSIERSPWQCSLQYMGQHVCGCSIIAPRYVLTAAHCFQRTQQQVDRWRVEVGHSNLAYLFAIPIDNIFVQRNYIIDLKPNDIALAKLKYDLSFSASVQPICLPGFDDELRAGAPLSVTGWGNTMEGGGSVSPTLQEVSVNLISRDVCNNDYFNQITDSMMCAGQLSGGKDTCQGDSGGPLVSLGDYWEQVGIVSWGDGCGRPGKPGVYTQTSSFLGWIYAAMQYGQSLV